jgi:hypothetical protein
MALLAKRQAALNLAMQQGRENPVDRAIRILETALNDVLLTLDRMADEEEWTLVRKQERVEEVHGPVETLIRSARTSRRDTTIAAWVMHLCR